jgi:hypothetical protein
MRAHLLSLYFLESICINGSTPSFNMLIPSLNQPIISSCDLTHIFATVGTTSLRTTENGLILMGILPLLLLKGEGPVLLSRSFSLSLLFSEQSNIELGARLLYKFLLLANL